MRCNEKIYEFLHIYGPDAKATDGATAPIKNALPVPLGSGDIKILGEIKVGRTIRDEGTKQALRPFAAALRSFSGPDGSLTLQGIGTKLRAIPGFSEAVEEQRITDIGALQRILDVFPEFVVEGPALKSFLKVA